MPPKVSVVTATYNYGHYLPGAIDSVLEQTYGDWELIIVDDGSTDNTAQVVRPYLADSRIRYCRTANRGQPAAENEGIRRSSGEFVAFLDADDLWLPHKLDRQLGLFVAAPNLGVVYSHRLTIDPSGRLLPGVPRPLFRGNILERLFRSNFVCFSSSVVRRSAFDALGLFSEDCRHASDYEFWLRVALRYEFDYVDEPLVMYRTGHANLTSRGEVQLLTALRIMDRFMARHRGKLPRKAIRVSYAETYAHIGEVKACRFPLAAFRWHFRALATYPLCWEAWRLLAALLVPAGARRLLRSLRNAAWSMGARARATANLRKSS